MNVFDWIVLCLCREILRLLSPSLVVCDEHPATAGGDDLIAVVAETGDIPQTPHGVPFVRGTQTLGCVFNYFQTKFLRYREDGVQIDGMTEYMDGYHSRD